VQSIELTSRGRIRAALIAGGASLVLTAATLGGTALAADQTTQSAQTVERIGVGPPRPPVTPNVLHGGTLTSLRA